MMTWGTRVSLHSFSLEIVTPEPPGRTKSLAGERLVAFGHQPNGILGRSCHSRTVDKRNVDNG
eukprot:scaffold34916_cov170-Amphora_coffeaeformis.AAC.15